MYASRLARCGWWNAVCPLGLLTIVTALVGPAMAIAAAPAMGPNIVLIVSDDQGYGDYGFMGHRQIKTPRLDRLAAESLAFRHGYVTSSLCRPSLATLLTGLYPHEHGITCNDPPLPAGKKGRAAEADGGYRAAREAMIAHIERVPTLPRLLGSAGYRSFQTGKWWEGNFRRGGFTHGMTEGQRHGDAGLVIGRETMQPMYDFVAASVAAGQPFLLWYAPMLPHSPHTPPERFLDKYRSAAPNNLETAKYWACIEWFDETCGQLLDFLDQRKLTDNTIVVYVTDNGWIQHPERDAYAPRSKQSQYDGGLRTPILLRWPGHIAPASSDTPISSIDLAPTLLKLAGQPVPKEMTGIDLLDTAAVNQRPAIFGECFTHNAVDVARPAANLRWRWLVAGGWKLIVPATANEPDASVELYHLARDPDEQRNLATEELARVSQLRQQLDSWWRGE